MIKFPQLKNIKPPNLKLGPVHDGFSLGLDMGSSSVKLVKLKFSAEKPELLSFAIEPYEQSPESVLKKILQSQDIRKVNISVSGPATIIRYVDFPKNLSRPSNSRPRNTSLFPFPRSSSTV